MVLIYSGRIMRPLSYALKCNKLSQNLASKNNQHQFFTVSVEAGGKKLIKAELKLFLSSFLSGQGHAVTIDSTRVGSASMCSLAILEVDQMNLDIVNSRLFMEY